METTKLHSPYLLERDRKVNRQLVAVIGIILVLIISFLFTSKGLAGDENKTAQITQEQMGPVTSTNPSDEAQKQRIAVALNYCKASFHRINKNPNSQVIRDERDHILNNLNLEGIGDTEIIKLYGSVLDEIGQLPLVKKEQDMYASKFRGAVARQIGFDSLALGLQVATAQYVSAIRTGASSWWDVRNSMWTKETELFRIEKSRVQTVITKSSTFLETFWKLARNQGIPDRWLIRDDDLERFEKALAETNLETRERMLSRLEPFMEYYPPYWYARGRTEQVQGHFVPAGESYTRLERIGKGHFRRDEMLASGLANYALIQDYLGKPDAAAIAQRALDCQADVWQANLACAQVLSHATEIATAEEAVYRNLDTDLEKQVSSSLLLMIYNQHNQKAKIIQRLSDPKFLQHVAGPVVVLSMSKLEVSEVPVVAKQYLADSIMVRPQWRYGTNELLVVTSPQWNMPESKLALRVNNQVYKTPEYVMKDGKIEAKFSGITEFGQLRNKPVQYPDIKLEMTMDGYQPVIISMRNGLPQTAVKEQVVNKVESELSTTTNVSDVKQSGLPEDLVLPYPEVLPSKVGTNYQVSLPAHRDYQQGDYTMTGVTLGNWKLGESQEVKESPEKVTFKD